LHVGGDAADLSRADDHVAVAVSPEIKPGFLKLRIIVACDPCAAALRPFLVDQELVVVLNKKFGGVARLLLGITEQPARQNEIAGKQRRTAFAHQALAYDNGLDALAMQVERGITAGRTASHNDNLRLENSHAKTAPTALRRFMRPSRSVWWT